MRADPAIKRCAIYTRVSDDEGLEQEFNSLDAQREAGEFHIKAQTQAGWVILPERYDDGGFSAKDLERPAARRLLQDIKEGKIDIVVVYKIDRLSRNMADFVDLMKLFEKHNVTFVSVTQHFNTETAMGKLILNILQSFAQFEREMTAERIRDKVAASKKKGMWMGGPPPLGYDVVNQKLEINKAEADTVSFIFSRFLETGSTTALMRELDAKGLRSKSWVSVRKQKKHGGTPIAKVQIYKILRNPLYIGKVRHKEQLYEGQHKAIVDHKTWDKIQRMIDNRASKTIRIARTDAPALLRGLLFDPDGYALCTAASNKGNKVYRYYVSTQAVKKSYDHCPIKNIPAHMLEEIVTDQIKRLLVRPEWAVRIAKQDDDLSERTILQALRKFESLWDELFPAEQSRILNLLVEKISVHTDKLIMTLRPLGMISLLHEIMSDIVHIAPQPDVDSPVTLIVPVAFKRRAGRKHITTPDGQDIVSTRTPRVDSSMIRAIVRGYELLELMDANPGLNTVRLGKEQKLDASYVAKYIRITQLAPDIIDAIMNGRQPKTLSMSQLLRPFPDLWHEQRMHFGFNQPNGKVVNMRS